MLQDKLKKNVARITGPLLSTENNSSAFAEVRGRFFYVYQQIFVINI